MELGFEFECEFKGEVWPQETQFCEVGKCVTCTDGVWKELNKKPTLAIFK